METIGKKNFLKDVMAQSRDPVEVLERVLLEYRNIGEAAKVELVAELVIELSAFHFAAKHMPLSGGLHD